MDTPADIGKMRNPIIKEIKRHTRTRMIRACQEDMCQEDRMIRVCTILSQSKSINSGEAQCLKQMSVVPKNRTLVHAKRFQCQLRLRNM